MFINKNSAPRYSFLLKPCAQHAGYLSLPPVGTIYITYIPTANGSTRIARNVELLIRFIHIMFTWRQDNAHMA